MAAMQNVEAEAAKFLQKLIHESKDEPAKLATKLYVILQHMTASGKENSMPYQVISKAMETVINDHGLDFEALKSSRLPTSGGPQIGESSQSQSAGSKLTTGVANESKSGLKESNLTRADALSSSLPPAGSYVAGHPHQVPASHRRGTSLDNESPSSLDTRSGDSYSQDRRDRGSWEQQANQKETKQPTTKRKKSGSTSVIEPHTNTSEYLEAHGQGADMRQGKLVNKIEPGSFPGPAVNFQAGSTGVSNSYMAVGGFSGTPSFGPSGKIPVDSEYWKPAFNGANANFPERPVQGHVFSTQLGEEAKPTVSNPASRSVVENAGSSSNMSMDADRVVQGAAVNTLNEMNMLRGAASGDSAKSVVLPIPSAPGMPFKEHHLKQLRAQCLVFLAFRNGIMPKRMHLEIALGSNLQTEGNNFDGASRDSVDSRGKEQTGVEPNKAIQEKIIHGGKGLRHETVNGGHAHADNPFSTPLQPYQGSNMEQEKIMPANDAKTLGRHGLPGQTVNNGNQYSSLGKRSSEFDEEALPRIDASLPSAEYTTSEYWIMVHQKRRLVSRQSWVKKQEKANQSIRSRFNELKETVSSSEDISAKTKSVIELKKLQLIELQRRLRSNLMNDFFKVIKPEIDYLKGIKKHRIGRRLKQVEKYEQRMKEERQKRIRERQKEFFSELELHKDRLEDLFKFKRERGRGFNKYVKEFHKRKERIHREKIDRIQREKINLLKINDVEGYLRMVQDAKSDRVKQLLKETEKYLQKLGSKLQEAKTVARLFEAEMDEDSSSSIYECSFIGTENEDENDQAKHYKESNEKYYMIAHSIKENITEQPTSLRGGKLREYQMNGLRWLVSLYNNHLNGILADEMGLGKTVQVIALMCYLMEAKNDRGPFLVVVPSSVLPGWESEINFWAPGINKIVYSGPPEERRKLFKERIIHQKFNVLLTTYEYLMNKHDRPKLSKVHWHYIIIDEGHRIKNASCKLNADLKYYHSSHRLLLTGTPLQNNLEELWALLNFLLPNIFNSSEDFSQWFNKPFESNGDNSADEALLSEEENLLIINRLHQVLRPFVLRRLKHKVENELPEKIERLVRCEASAYQKLLMKRVEDNLGPLGSTKVRSVHNSVIELRNICNHPYLSQLHTDEVDALIPKHFLPPIVRLCGKLEVLDRLLPKLKATNHRILFFSTMTRLLDVMEEYLGGKKYPYLRLDGHTSGSDRGALIEKFNHPDSPFFIFLLSIRAGGVGVNLQAADTVIIFDTDWNPQVDLQAQARAHRIGQKKDVLVLRLETVNTVEEQVRAAAEHKLGVANQSITAGFFDNNTSAEDRREYLESLLRECKKEEAAPVLNDDGLNDLLARSESEIEIFESIDRKRQEEEMEAWKKMLVGQGIAGSGTVPPLPPRLVTDEELKPFYDAMRLYEVQTATVPNTNVKRKRGHLGGFDTQQYGRGKRAREVRSYEEQWNETEFEKICQDEYPGNLKPKEEIKDALLSVTGVSADKIEQISHLQGPITSEQSPIKQEVAPPVKRGRGRPKRVPVVASPSALAHPFPTMVHSQAPSPLSIVVHARPDSVPTEDASGRDQPVGLKMESNFQTSSPLPSLMANSSGVMPPSVRSEPASARLSSEVMGAADVGRQRGRKPYNNPPSVLTGASSSAAISLGVQNPQSSEAPTKYVLPSVTSVFPAQSPSVVNSPVKETIRSDSVEMIFNSQTTLSLAAEPSGKSPKGKGTTEAGHRRGRKSNKNSPSLPPGSAIQALKSGDQPVVYVSSSSAFSVQNLQVTEQSVALASQSPKSGEHPVKETVSALLADSSVATREDASKHVSASISAGYCGQGLDSNSKVVKETSSTAPGLAIQSEESNKQLTEQAPTTVASSLALQEPKSRKRKTKPLSSDISSLAVASPVASPGNPLLQDPVVSVVPPSSISAATMALSGSPPCVGGPFSVRTASDSQHMPHERQMNKSRSGVETARRRGRKPTLPTDAAPIESLIQDSRIAPTVTAFPGPPGVANLAMASRTVANPVVPLVPVSGLIPGFIAVKDFIGSVHPSNVGSPPISKSNPQSSSIVSAQADPSLKTEGQTQESSFRETTSHRRGRKTAPAASSDPSILTVQDSSLRHMESVAGDLREGKRARLNLEDGSLASGKVQEAQSAIDHAPSLIKEAESNVENTIPPANVAIPATVIEESASNKANEVDKSLESKKELSAADAPLMSSNVHVVTSRLPICKTTLVLALRAAELKAAALNSRASASEPDGNSSSNFASLSQLYGEMSAPPGFDTPRACLDATVGTSLGSENAKSMGKSAVLHEEFSLPGNKLMLGPNESLVDPADFIDDDSAPPGFDMGKSCLLSAKISNSLRAKQAESSSGASFEPDVTKVETQLDSGGDGIDSSDLVYEDSVPPGFEPETCDLKEKNGSAEVSISLATVSLKGNEGQNSVDISHEVCHDVQTSVVLENLVEKHGKETKDVSNFPKDDPFQAKDLGLACEANIIKPEIDVPSEGFKGSLAVGSVENTCALDTGKAGEGSSKIPPDSLHLPGASVLLTEKNAPNATSVESLAEQTEPTIEVSSFCLADLNVVADASVCDLQGKASPESLAGPVLVDLVKHCACETKDGCHVENEEGPISAVVLRTAHEVDIGKPGFNVSSTSDDGSLKEGTEEDMGVLEMGKDGDSSSKIPPVNAALVESFVEQAEPSTMPSPCKADLNTLVDASVGDIESKASGDSSHVNSDVGFVDYHVDAADTSGSVLVSRHEENSQVIDADEIKSSKSDPSTQINEETGGLVESDGKDDLVIGNSVDTANSSENLAELVESVPENLINEVNTKDISYPDACQVVGRTAVSSAAVVPESQPQLINEDLSTKKTQDTVDSSIKTDEITAASIKISVIGSCDEESMADVNSEEDTVKPSSKSECSSLFDSSLSCAASSEKQEVASPCSAQVVHSAELPLNTIEISSTQPEENAEAAVIVASEPCGNRSSSEDADLSQHPISEDSLDPAVVVASNTVSGDNEIVVAVCSMQPIMGTSSNVVIVSVSAENLPPTEISLNLVEVSGNKPEENADSATAMAFEASGNTSSATEDTDLMLAVDPSLAVVQNVVSREDPMTEAESSTQPVLDTSSEVPKVSSSDDIGQASWLNLKEREETCRVDQSASLGNSDDGLVTQALEPQKCTAKEKYLSAEVPISSGKVFIKGQNLMEESHGIDRAVKTSLVPEDLVEKDDPLQAVDLGTHKGGISEPEIGLISDSVIRHEEESQDVDHKSEESDPLTQLTVDSGNPLKLDQKDDSVVGDGNDAANSAENVAELVEPVPENQMNEVNSEDVLIPEARQEVDGIVESPVQNITELQSHPTSEELSAKQSHSANDVGVSVTESHENADATGILVSKAFVNGSSSEDADFSQHPVLEASMDPSIMATSDAVSGDDLMVESECSVQPTMESSSDATYVEPSHRDPRDDLMVEAECSMQPVLEALSVVEPSHGVSGDDQLKIECFSQPVLETSSDAAIVEPSHTKWGDDLMVEAECPVQHVLETSNNAGDLEPSHGVTDDDNVEEAKCPMQPVLETSSDAATLEPSHDVTGNNHVEEVKSPTQLGVSADGKTMEAESIDKLMLESSGDAAVGETSHTDSGDDLVVEAECPVQPVLETSNNAGDLEPSHGVTGDDHVEEAECPMQPVPETSSAAAALEPCQDVAGDNHAEEIKRPKQPVLETSSDAAALELSHYVAGDNHAEEGKCWMQPGVSADDQTMEAESLDKPTSDVADKADSVSQPVLETSIDAVAEPSNGVSSDDHTGEVESRMQSPLEISRDAAVVEPSNGVSGDVEMVQAESSVQPMMETSGDTAVVEPSNGVSGDDEMVQAESSVQPMMETSGDAPNVEPPHVVSGDDNVEAESSKQPTLDTSSDVVVVEPSQVVSDDRHVEEAEQRMIELSPVVGIGELSHGTDGDDQMAEAEVRMQPGLETSSEAVVVEPSHCISGDDQMVDTESSEHRMLETSSTAPDVDPSHDVAVHVHKEEAESLEDHMLETSCNAADVDGSHGVAVDDHNEEAESSEHPMLETSIDAVDVHPPPSVAVGDHEEEAESPVRPASQTSGNAAVVRPSNVVPSDDHLPETGSATQAPSLESSTEAADLEPSHFARGR